jgi:hypothetical protein
MAANTGVEFTDFSTERRKKRFAELEALPRLKRLGLLVTFTWVNSNQMAPDSRLVEYSMPTIPFAPMISIKASSALLRILNAREGSLGFAGAKKGNSVPKKTASQIASRSDFIAQRLLFRPNGLQRRLIETQKPP